MNRKLLFLTSRLPYPQSSGRKNVMYNYCKYLHEKYNYDIINISFMEKGDTVDNKPDFIEKTYVLQNPSIVSVLASTFLYTVLLGKYPTQVSIFYKKSIKKQIDAIISSERPDLVMCDMIRTAEYLKDIDIPKILDMDDLLSIRYKRQMGCELEYINPYGAYINRFPSLLRRILMCNAVKRRVLDAETKMLVRYEKNISKYYDCIVFVAQKEADEINSMISGNKAFAVPLGVDVSYYKRDEGIEKENYISFMGVMNVAHNETAVLYFYQQIFPIIKSKAPGTKLQIIGGGVSEKLKAVLTDDVVFTGYVEDIRPYLSKSKVFVCPLIYGSGIKTKILHAMAMGIPVVTSSIGAESIDAVDGIDWLVRDDKDEFAEAVVRLLEDEEYNRKISENGHRYVMDKFDWNKVINKWDDVFEYLNCYSKGLDYVIRRNGCEASACKTGYNPG